MDFELPEEHKILQKTVRDFCEKEIIPHADKWEEEEYLPMDIVRTMGKLGFYSAPYPAEYGGSEAGWLANSIVCEELGRAWLSLAGAVCNPNMGLTPMAILFAGSAEQKAKYLPHLAAGEILGCTALTEPNAATDVGGIQTTAVLDGNHYILNGSKTWATNCTIAGVTICYAKTNPRLRHEGLSAFLLEPGLPGMTTQDIKNKMGVRALHSGHIFLDNCRVPEEALLGQAGKGWDVAMTGLQYGRMTVAARALGLTEACLDASLKYATTREQFGQKIGKFQTVKSLIAEMVILAESARYPVYKAAWLADQKKPCAHEANIAKYIASEAGARAARHAQQIHGSYGYTIDYPVARYFRDSMLFISAEGSNLIQSLIIADDVLGFKKAEQRRTRVS